jgi:hypothetical protein
MGFPCFIQETDSAEVILLVIAREIYLCVSGIELMSSSLWQQQSDRSVISRVQVTNYTHEPFLCFILMKCVKLTREC